MTYPTSAVRSVLPIILHLTFASYLVFLVGSNIATSEIEEHWPIVVHVAALTTLSVVVQCVSMLIPDDGTIKISFSPSTMLNFGRKFMVQLAKRKTDEDEEDETKFFWYTSLILTTIVWALSISIPRGPERYFPPERVYTIKSIEHAAKERGELGDDQGLDDPAFLSTRKVSANVCGLVASSVWGVLMFSYTTAVVMLGYTAASLEIADLPILPASMRSTYIFSHMRRLLRSSSEASGRTRSQFTIRVPFAGFLARRFPSLQERFPNMSQGRTFTPFKFNVAKHSPTQLLLQLIKANKTVLALEVGLAASSALVFYTPAYFFKRLIIFLENDPRRGNGNESLTEPQSQGWAWVYCAGLFGTTAAMYILTGQLWSISTTVVQLKFKIQLNTMLFAKTLVRKNIPGNSSSESEEKTEDAKAKSDKLDLATHDRMSTDGETDTQVGTTNGTATSATVVVNERDATTKETVKKSDEEEFSSKAQVMTLMTTDVDRVADFSWHLFSLVDSPIEIVIGGYFLYTLLGISAFWGLAASLLFIPVNHWASKVVVKAQDDLMKARDERVALMNEILGGIRMLKFMAWERSFEKRVLKVRDKELSHQWRNYVIEVEYLMLEQIKNLIPFSRPFSTQPGNFPRL
ncbi:hypothetical protein FRB91_005500 [Serendipita sp. 411]|nr:hypothetical protein FRB91_005500 [Serendipita sp. 411]